MPLPSRFIDSMLSIRPSLRQCCGLILLTLAICFDPLAARSDCCVCQDGSAISFGSTDGTCVSGQGTTCSDACASGPGSVEQCCNQTTGPFFCGPPADTCAAATPTGTSTATPTETGTPTETATVTPTSTQTPTATVTPTGTVTDTPTVSPTATLAGTETSTPTTTPTGTTTETPTVTSTPTATGSATDTPTMTPTATSTATPVSEGGACLDTSQCASGLACIDGICMEVTAPAPAMSRTGLLVVVGILVTIGAVTLRRRPAS